MKKRITILSLLALSVFGLKAQTYCYHNYALYTQTGSESHTYYFDYNDRLSFEVFTFQGDFLKCPIYTSGTWKVDYIGNGGTVNYAEFDKNIFGKWKKITYSDPSFGQFIEVSGDRNRIVYSKISKSTSEIYYYERCPDQNCYQR